MDLIIGPSYRLKLDYAHSFKRSKLAIFLWLGEIYAPHTSSLCGADIKETGANIK